MKIVERLTQSVQLTDEAARRHLANRFVRVNNEIVTDPDTEVTTDDRLLLQPPPAE